MATLRRNVFLLVPLVCLIFGLSADGQDVRLAPISVELIITRGFTLGAEQPWLRTLREAGVTQVRVRQGNGIESPKISNSGTQAAPRYRVIGILATGNRLLLPGQSFTPRQVTDLRKWFERVRTRGIDATLGKPEAFGLTAGELAKLHEQLENRVATVTQGQSLRDVCRDLEKTAGMPLRFSAKATAAIAEADPCPDDLMGISSGTALAAALRPAGLVMVPKALGRGRFSFQVVSAREVEEFWPVGWPSNRTPGKLAPSLMKFVVIEISKQPLDKVLTAMAEASGVPLLYDHNSLALAGIEPIDINVELPSKRSLFKSHIDRILQQAKLKGKLRMDESGRPLIWVTTIRK